MSDPPPPFPPPPSLEPPPGYAGVEGNTAAGVGGLTTIGGLSRWAIVLPILASIASLIGTLLVLGAKDDIDAFLDGTISESEFEDAIAASGGVSIVSGVLSIAAVVVVLIWCARIARNHRALGRATTWGPGMAVGGWFLPPFLFVIPMLFLHEAWRAADPTSPPGDDGWRRARANPMVFVWWVLYGVVPLAFIPVMLQRFDGFGADTEDLAESMSDALGLQVAAGVVQVVAAIAWAILASQLSARHRQFTGEARR